MVISHEQNLQNHLLVKLSPTLDKVTNHNNHTSPTCKLLIDFDQNIHHNYETIVKDLISKISLDILHVKDIIPVKKDISYLKINSPPYLNKNIKNYNYIDLIPIIKSNS